MIISKKYTNKNFWKNKSILITGVNGFIGCNLVNHFLSVGANIIGISNNNNKNIALKYNNTLSRIKYYNISLIDKFKLKEIISKNKIEFCYHLAAQVDVTLARHDPFETFESNIRGTYNLLELLRNSKSIKSIVVASSDKAYGEYPFAKLPYKENYDLRPIYPYDVSKACGDLISKCYSSKIYGLPIITTRFSNIYGPGQLNFSALIPDCILAILNIKKFIPRSNGKNKRDYLFVDDVCDLYLCLGYNLYKDRSLSGEVFNAGTGKGYSVNEIVKTLCKISNNKKLYENIKNKFQNSRTIGEIKNQFMSYSKLKKYFGWTPSYKMNEGLDITLNWYRKIFENNTTNKELRKLIK